MFIKRLNIEEFRGVKKCDKPLELSKFTVLVGKNNSGKSAILEALYLLVTSNPEYVSRAYRTRTMELMQLLHGGASSLVYAYSGNARVEYLIGQQRIWAETDGKQTILNTNGKTENGT
jgi:recombinational DNA repair ATPase RecF